MWNDLKYAVRGLRQKPGLAFLVVATLTTGMAGAACLFSFINAWMIEPLPFSQPERLTHIRGLELREGRQTGVSRPDARDIRERARGFESIAAWAPSTFTLSLDSAPERIAGARVSTNFFDVLGIKPRLGRAFRAEEGDFGRHYAVILSEGFWRTRLNADPSAIGQTIRLGSERYEVVGVLPEDFQFTLVGRANVWVPDAIPDEEASRRQDRYWTLLARRPAGVTQAQAARELTEITAQLAREFPETNANRGSFTLTLAEEVGQHTGNGPLFALFLITLGLLLIACSNTANLLLARAMERRRQAAIQLSMGAGRARLVRQALFESVLLFLTAAALAALAGWWLTDVISSWVPFENRGYLPNYGVVALHWRVFAFMAGTALLTALIFGLAPALEASRADVTLALKESGSSVSGSRGTGRVRSGLVVAQIALATVLLGSTGLLVQAFRSMWTSPNGFDPEDVTTFQMALDQRRYPEAKDVRGFYDRAIEAVRAATGASEVAVSWSIPFTGSYSATTFLVAGGEVPERGKEPRASLNSIGREYLRAMKIPLKAGRDFAATDGPDTAPVAIVNESFARRYFPQGSAVGQKITLLRTTPVTLEVVGVVGDIRIDVDHPRVDPEILTPFAQRPDASARFVIRAPGSPDALLAAARRALAEVDPEQPVFAAKTMNQWLDERFAPMRIVGSLSAGFGVLALVMAAVGVYSVIAFSVSQRTKEFGIRAALGADRGRLMKLVTGHGIRLLAIGFVPGICLALLAAMGIRSAMTGIADIGTAVPMILAAVSVLSAAALGATLIPAWRASEVDPARAMRYE